MPLLGLALLAGCRGYESIEVDGTRRDFLLHVPAGAAPAEGRPLVIAFHGAYSTPDATEDYTGLSTLADAEDFVVVYPKGKQRLWNDGRIPDAYDDVAFTAALIDHLIASEDVDPDRVFVTGISNGGFMAHRIGCDLGDRVAAIAPVAGTLSQELLEVCEPAGPVAMMMFMGTDDDLVPYEGGELGGKLGAGIFGTMLSARDTAEQWAGFEGCVGEPALETRNAVDDGTQVETLRYAGCDERGPVVLHTIVGGGHSWPGADEATGLGPVSAELDASAEMWAFFSAL